MNQRRQSSADDLGGKVRTVAVLLAGAFSVLFAMLFASVNDEWIVIQMPHPPWRPEPSWSAFEARLWAVMAAGFVLGVLVASVGVYFYRRRMTRFTSQQAERIEELSRELDKTNRLLAATKKTM
jgi:sterol desaturase/sphingolipid hydroxylase (fatty acid hydroxylase superfamily)